MNSEQYDPTKAKGKQLGAKLRRLLWTVVSLTIFRYSPFFCHGWRRFLLRCFGAKIAGTATVGRRAVIDAPWNLTMGERAMICSDAWVACDADIEIGDQSMIGAFARVLAGSHDSNSNNFKPVVTKILIEKNCWIASCAMLVGGGRKVLKIGEGAIVGAGAVVFTNVKPSAIMVGNPAEKIAERSFNKA